MRNFFSKAKKSGRDSEDSSYEENLRNAIDLRQKKSKATDFYIRLSELTERIEVY